MWRFTFFFLLSSSVFAESLNSHTTVPSRTNVSRADAINSMALITAARTLNSDILSKLDVLKRANNFDVRPSVARWIDGIGRCLDEMKDSSSSSEKKFRECVDKDSETFSSGILQPFSGKGENREPRLIPVNPSSASAFTY